MHDAGLAGDHDRPRVLAGDAQQLVERGLAGAVIAERDLTDADHRIDVHDVASHAAGQCYRRHVIAAGVAIGVEALFAQAAGFGQQRFCIAGNIVRAEQSDDSRDAAAGKSRQPDRRNPARETGLTTAAGHMRMTVDQPGYQAPPGAVARIAY